MTSLANSIYKVCRLIFAVLVCFVGVDELCAGDLGTETAKPDQHASNTLSSQIEQWAAELDDDRFDVRQRAQQHLEQAGKPALEAVALIAKAGSLESVTRATNIMLRWSQGKEIDLQLAALEKLAGLKNRPRESARAIRLLAVAREQTARGTLIQLGARVERDLQIQGQGQLQVTIGPEWRGGKEGLQHLTDMRHATTVSLHVAPLDDSAVDYLVKLPQVRRLELYGTKFSPEAVAKLKEQLPGADIVERGGAMLGIRGNVESVVKNSAAHKAGIQARDRITEFEGEKVANFEALTERIAKKKPGDTVTLTILRNNQTKQVQVTFDQWGTKPNIVVPPPQRQQRIPVQIPPGFPPKLIVPAK